MNKPVISVIVPLYKAEGTLFRCLDSLKEQTFKEFEVLMVDDGSPDRCGELIDSYAQKDHRFIAIHKENGGVSSARQYGIDHAQGVYTIHADPDDWVEPTMLEDLYRKAQANDADMVICDYYENTYKGQKYVKQQPSSLDHLTVQKELFQHLHGSCCNKLVKRSCYRVNGITFPEGVSYCEDQYVNCAILMNDISIYYLPKAFYHYVRGNVDSLSRKYTLETYQMDIRLRDIFDELFHKSPYRKMVYQYKTKSIVLRAFYGGKDVFSSKDFRRLFSPMSNTFMTGRSPHYIKLLIGASCCGFYQPMRTLVTLLMKAKHVLNRCH